MLQTLIRVALQVVLFFLLLGAVVAIGDPQTGLVEKVAIGLFGLLLVWVAAVVRRFGAA
jgi:hypothetical protein